MAIADWFIVKTDSAMEVNLESGSPINGTGSLHINQEDIAETVPVAGTHLRYMAGYPQSQFSKGKVQTLIQPKQFSDGATSISFVGILAMMSQSNVFASGGKAYFAGRWGSTTPNWRIARLDNGMSGPNSFVPLSIGNTTSIPGANEVRAMEFEWIYDETLFNGVRLTLSISPDDDFGNLVQIYQIVDTLPSALSTTVGEGLFFSTLHTATGPVVETLYDKTRIFQLISIQ